MAIASVSTITSASPLSWQEAAEFCFARARQTLRNITGIEVIKVIKGIKEKARVEDAEIVEFLVTLKVIFLLDESEEA